MLGPLHQPWLSTHADAVVLSSAQAQGESRFTRDVPLWGVEEGKLTPYIQKTPMEWLGP